MKEEIDFIVKIIIFEYWKNYFKGNVLYYWSEYLSWNLELIINLVRRR